jgi:monoamine oxidase
LNSYFYNNIESFYGATPSDLSVKGIMESMIGYKNMGYIKEGYGELIKRYSEGLDIKTDHIVETIDYNDERIKVYTNQGVFKCDYVVCTVSLGCLKNKTIKFSPELSNSKLESIDKMGMGLLNKIYLEFEDNFWDENTSWITKFEDVNSDEKEISHYLSFDSIHKNSKILCAFLSSDFSKLIEKLEDQVIINKCMKVLKSIYKEKATDPISYEITRWNSDKFSYGSYSFDEVGYDVNNRKILAESVDNKLFFAGEATHDKSYSYVDGAFESGKREANRIIDLIFDF